VKVDEFYQDDHNFYIVTELCEGGELFDFIIEKHHFNEKQAAHVFQ
jgi:calcium-dependent protein kinase